MQTPSYTKLTEEQVQELLTQYAATKDGQLRERVILQYKQLVESIARRFAGSGEPMEDLAQEGYIGLLIATDHYDAERGVKFSTYATHFIIGQIKHALRDKGKIIKEPAWLQELNHRMTRVIEGLYQELGRQPTNAEIGRMMHLPEETVAELLTTREVLKVTSLDSDQDDTQNGGWDLDRMREDKPATFQLPVEDKIVLEMSMNKLKLIEQKVIQEFYFSGLSQTEIAKKLGISCNYVSHILRTGTRKLRRILTTEEIREVQMQLQLASRRSDQLTAEEEGDVLDSLTGTYNERYLNNRLTEELIRASRDKSEVGFAVLTVHGLEEFGARFGRMRRDDILCSLAQKVKDIIRRCDIMGRLGEYEFGLILLHTKQQSDRICARILKGVKAAEFKVEYSDTPVTLDAGMGWANATGGNQSAEDLIKLARKQMHKPRAKRLPKAA